MHCEIESASCMTWNRVTVSISFDDNHYGKDTSKADAYIIFTNPTARAGYDTRSVFKRSLTGLNSEFPSPSLVALPRLKYQSALLFTHSRRENNWIHTFPKGISAMWNAISLVQVWTRVAVSISYDDNHYTTGTLMSPCLLQQ